MNKEDEEIDKLFIKLESGELSVDQQSELKELMEKSSNYRKGAIVHEMLNEAFNKPEEFELYTQLENIHSRYKKRYKVIIWYKIAAVLVVLLTVGSLTLFYPFSGNNYDRLYTSNYTAFPAPDVNRTVSLSTNKTEKMAFQEYSNSQYENANKGFITLLKTDSLNTSYLFYSGICQMEGTNYNAAIKNFNRIINLNDPIFREPSLWYGSLCLIKQKSSIKAKERLTLIINEKGVYQHRALELLKKL